jgi:hypothetical protein
VLSSKKIGGTEMRMLRIPIIVFMLAALLVPTSVQAKPQAPASNPASITGIDCGLPESNAESLVILSNYYPGYWWDHTDLTIAVQAHPNAKPEQLAAIHDAIATWSSVLEECFDGLITLTNVTVDRGSQQRAADIVVHYVPRAGGVVFGGYAVCGHHGCPNIMVRSDLPPSYNADPYSPEYLGWVTLHEIGHALGLGHTTNLWESTDLMGYGWPDLGDPVLSDCDIDALEGSDPYPPAEGPYDCSLD